MSEIETDNDPLQGRQLSTPNDVPRRLCAMLMRLSQFPPHPERELIEHNGLTAVFLGMTAIEAFANIYARIIAEEPWFAEWRERVMARLNSSRTPTGVKLQTLGRVFGRPLNEGDARWIAFHELRELRNEFVHFRSGHETLNLPGFSIAGLVDTSSFASLSVDTPLFAMRCVRGIVQMVGSSRGIASRDLDGFVRLQTGLWPE